MTRINRLGIVLLFSAMWWQNVARHNEVFSQEISGAIAGFCLIIGITLLLTDGPKRTR